jgi:N-acetylglucosaminyldiphosphoundecaprenol N-acetyl-beta-D-mannosaminyltransferase
VKGSRRIASGESRVRVQPIPVPTTNLGGITVAALDMEATVAVMVEAVQARQRPGRPLFYTSANGEVVSRCARDHNFARIVALADLVSADGQPMVALSRYFGQRPLPERVATTDLFHGVARAAVEHGLTFYMLGATEEENCRATENALRLHPGLRIVGRSHGYLTRAEIRMKVAEINALAPDILWLALGVPREQKFVDEYGATLTEVGMIKTSGGLFNFLSGSRSRAPAFIQKIGLEWLWRLGQEPGRLLWRYATTNPHSLYLFLSRSRFHS